MEGFFSDSELSQSRKRKSTIPACGACGLFRSCHSPKMKPSGRGRKKILVVGEAPGKDEDLAGEAFVGKSGQVIRKALDSAGIDPDRDVLKTNALICRPPGNEIKDKDAVEYCRPNLLRVIKDFDPTVVLLLGKSAVQSVIGHLWKEEVGAVERWTGWRIPAQAINAWVCPTYHPSYLLRTENKVLDDIFTKHVHEAVSLTEKPWEEVPDLLSQVEVIMDHEQAAKRLRKMTRAGGLVAFDYEANMLKPDSEAAKLYSCAVCWEGEVTIAYPWFGEAIQATKEMLVSPNVRKIAANLKYEARWTKAKLGVDVVNWDWDTMVASHVADNRQGISSLKFQAFVHLGQSDYDSHVRPFFKTDGGNTPNRIKDVAMTDLLLYNGMDALLEFLVAACQKREMAYE